MENVNIEINYEEKKVEDSEKLNEQIEELKKEIEEWKKNYAIKLADFDNYKKRINKDFEEYKICMRKINNGIIKKYWSIR